MGDNNILVQAEKESQRNNYELQHAEGQAVGEPAGEATRSDELGQLVAERRAAIDAALQLDSGDQRRGEVSASTIGRMLGLVTTAEFKVLENKIDLMMTKMTTMISKVERMVGLIQAAPTGSDLERIDVQLAAIRTVLNDLKVSLTDAGSDEVATEDELAGSDDPDRKSKFIVKSSKGSTDSSAQ